MHLFKAKVDFRYFCYTLAPTKPTGKQQAVCHL